MSVERSQTELEPDDGDVGAQLDPVAVLVDDELSRASWTWRTFDESSVEISRTSGLRLLAVAPDVPATQVRISCIKI